MLRNTHKRGWAVPDFLPGAPDPSSPKTEPATARGPERVLVFLNGSQYRRRMAGPMERVK